MTKKESPTVTSARINRTAVIAVALITLVGTLVGILAILLKQTSQSSTIETTYVGHVIDMDNQNPIVKAKVTLDLQGISRIAYTDSEGTYQFQLAISSETAGDVRVDAQGYQVYTRNISISPDIKTIEDIRLTPQSSSSGSTPSTLLQLGIWSVDYFPNIQLDAPLAYHTDQPAEQNTEGGYTVQFNSVDLHSNPQIPQSNFSTRLSGLFYFTGGTYEFHCEHHDGCRVYVDGLNWIDAWWDGGGGHDMARDIPAGNHIVSIEFYDKSGLGLLQVQWRIKPQANVAPASAPEIEPVRYDYTVKVGETLRDISRKFLITDYYATAIGRANCNQSPAEGDILVIRYYPVQQGDTIDLISKKFGGTTNFLRSINGLNENVTSLPVGQILILPGDCGK
jgi:LysM repeat protein